MNLEDQQVKKDSRLIVLRTFGSSRNYTKMNHLNQVSNIQHSHEGSSKGNRISCDPWTSAPEVGHTQVAILSYASYYIIVYSGRKSGWAIKSVPSKEMIGTKIASNPKVASKSANPRAQYSVC